MSTLAISTFVSQVVPNQEEDQSVILNAELADPVIQAVELPSGVIWVAGTVRVPAGKGLILRSDTVLRALPDFAIIAGLNHIVLLGGSRAEISGGTVDANKVGLGGGSGARINGVVVFNGARDCRRTDVVVTNCTGYGIYDSGTDDLTTPPSSLNVGLRVLNCQVHYEQQGADGSTFIDCSSRDGDGDVPCLSWIHPLVASKRISFIGFSGYGVTPVGVDVAANIGDIEELHLENVHIELTNEGSVGMNVNQGNNNTRGLKVIASKFIAEGGIAVVLNQTSGSFSHCDFVGQTGVEHADSRVEFTGCTSTAVSTTTATPVGIIVTGTGQAQWTGGEITGSGGSGSPLIFRGKVFFAGGTRTTPRSLSIPVVRQEAYGAVTVAGVDATNSRATINLPFIQIDETKCFVTFSIRKTDATAVPDLAASTITWAFSAAGQLRVFIDGINLATPAGAYQLYYHIVERE